MIKLLKAIIIAIGAGIALLIGIRLLPIIPNYIKYSQNKAGVLKYVKENYDIEFRLVRSKIGEGTLIDHNMDTFYFRDITNNKDFRITSDNGYINDYYAIEILREQIDEKVKELFPNNDLDYSIIGSGLRSTSVTAPYEFIWCRLRVDEKDEADLSKTYRLVSLLNDEFIGMNLTLSFKPILRNRSDLSSYGLYNKEFKLTGGTFMNEDEFMKFMAEINPPRLGKYVGLAEE